MSIDISADRFGNRLITLDDKNSHLSVADIEKVLNFKFGKAVIFYGLSQQSADDFNDQSTQPLKYQADLKSGSPVHLYRNGSTCPELHDGNIFAAGAVIIARHAGIYYVIYAKDRTKRVITNIGGTCDAHEYEQHKTDILTLTTEIAIREVFEETSDNGKESLSIDKDAMKLLYHLNSVSRYFGIEGIDDNYYAYGVYYNLEEKDELKKNVFLRKLFGTANLDENGNYNLQIDNNEIEYIHAFPLGSVTNTSFCLRERLEKILNRQVDYRFAVYAERADKPFISGVNLPLAYMFLFEIMGFDDFPLRDVVDKVTHNFSFVNSINV